MWRAVNKSTCDVWRLNLATWAFSGVFTFGRPHHMTWLWRWLCLKSSLVSLSCSLILKLCQHIDSSLAGWWARQERWGMKRKHWQPVEAIKNPQSVLRQSKSRPWQRMVGNQKHPRQSRDTPSPQLVCTHTRKQLVEKTKGFPLAFQPPKSPFTKEKLSSIFCKRIPC